MGYTVADKNDKDLPNAEVVYNRRIEHV